MLRTKHSLTKALSNAFIQMEKFLSVVLSILLAGILVVFLVRIIDFSYVLVFSKIGAPTTIKGDSITELFAMIINLLIAKEFMNTLVFTIRNNKIKILVKDIALLAGLAVLRKLILVDYTHTSPANIIATGLVLVAIGLFYVAIDFNAIWLNHKGSDKTPS